MYQRFFFFFVRSAWDQIQMRFIVHDFYNIFLLYFLETTNVFPYTNPFFLKIISFVKMRYNTLRAAKRNDIFLLCDDRESGRGGDWENGKDIKIEVYG